MVGAILFTFATIMEPLLALAVPALYRILVALLLGYLSDGGVIDEGNTDSTMITPCCSSSVAIMGIVVVMSLIMSLYGVINMATMVCSS
jgi:hypothetical protein